MTSIAIVLDAASDIGAEHIKLHNFHLVAYHINFKSSSYTTAQLSAERLAFLINQRGEMPTTSPPSAREYEATFLQLLRHHDEVLSITVSGGLSAAPRNARAAAANLDGRVTVHDTRTASYTVAQQAIRAAQLREKGHSVSEIVAELERFGEQQYFAFKVDDLKSLEHSGRIKPLQALVGGLLGIKPIVSVRNGELKQLASPRGDGKAIETLTKELIKFGGRINTAMEVTFLYSPGGETFAHELRQVVRELGYEDAGLLPMGSVVSAVSGGRTVAVAACPSLEHLAQLESVGP